MGLNINNSNNRLSIFRMNGIYCAIIFIVHYIICLNGFIYMEYDENKHHYDECLWRRYPIDFSDYHKYGPSFRECVFFFTDPDTNLVEVSQNDATAPCYVGIKVLCHVKQLRQPFVHKHPGFLLGRLRSQISLVQNLAAPMGDVQTRCEKIAMQRFNRRLKAPPCVDEFILIIIGILKRRYIRIHCLSRVGKLICGDTVCVADSLQHRLQALFG